VNARQEMFCREYIISLNATEAAIKAGYSKRTARQQGQRLFTNVDVQERIAELQKESFGRAEIDADRVLKELEHLATYDPRKVLDWGPDGFRIKDSSELTAQEAKIITGLSESPSQWGWRRQVKLADRLRALELLGKHYSLFAKRLHISGPDDGPIEIVEINPIKRQNADCA
jgi:phage terminase small subunit